MIENEEDRQMSFEVMELRAKQARRDTEDFFTRIFRIAWEVLSDRLLLFLAMASTAALFFWSLVEPSGLRFAGAVAYGLIVFVPMLYVSLKRKTK